MTKTENSVKITRLEDITNIGRKNFLIGLFLEKGSEARKHDIRFKMMFLKNANSLEKDRIINSLWRQWKHLLHRADYQGETLDALLSVLPE